MSESLWNKVAADPYLQDVMAEVEALLDQNWHASPTLVSRRAFLKITGLAGGGFGLALMSRGGVAFASEEGEAPASGSLNAYVQVGGDGVICSQHQPATE